jgi:hypothetical protein
MTSRRPQRRSYIIVSETAEGMEVAKMAKEELGVDALWVSRDNGDPKYFKGSQLIPHNWFWFLVLPYNKCVLELASLTGQLIKYTVQHTFKCHCEYSLMEPPSPPSARSQELQNHGLIPGNETSH